MHRQPSDEKVTLDVIIGMVSKFERALNRVESNIEAQYLRGFRYSWTHAHILGRLTDRALAEAWQDNEIDHDTLRTQEYRFRRALEKMRRLQEKASAFFGITWDSPTRE